MDATSLTPAPTQQDHRSRPRNALSFAVRERLHALLIEHADNLGREKDRQIATFATFASRKLNVRITESNVAAARAHVGMPAYTVRRAQHIARIAQQYEQAQLPEPVARLADPAPPAPVVPGPQLTLVSDTVAPEAPAPAPQASDPKTAKALADADPWDQADDAGVDWDDPAAARQEYLEVIRWRLAEVQADHKKLDDVIFEFIELEAMLEDTPQASWATLSLVRRSLRRLASVGLRMVP